MPPSAKVIKGSAGKRPRLGPYSRGLHRAAIGKIIDGRSEEGRFLRAYEAMLLRHVGSNPSAVMRQLIIRACRLALYVELMDRRSLIAGGMTEHDRNYYLAWSNALRRTLLAIGIEKPSPPPSQTLGDYLAGKSRRRAAETTGAVE